MRIIHLKDISAADLISPVNLFYLPMEVVLTSPQEALPVFPTVRAYKLPRGKYLSEGIDQYLLEVWGDSGEDGHTDYTFRGKFILLSETELPTNFGAYIAVKNEV